MSSTFFLDHRARLAQLQSDEDGFVWDRRKDNGELWFLDDNTATEHRSFVMEFVVCSVPGCAAPLTTAHYKNKRDHLRRLSLTGNHGQETLLHSNGCALIESWLASKYPDSRVKREEYTNEQGERRTDVLLTGKQGDRVAFEIHYGSLTPDEWHNRHDSYHSQGIRDLWFAWINPREPPYVRGLSGIPIAGRFRRSNEAHARSSHKLQVCSGL